MRLNVVKSVVAVALVLPDELEVNGVARQLVPHGSLVWLQILCRTLLPVTGGTPAPFR